MTSSLNQCCNSFIHFFIYLFYRGRAPNLVPRSLWMKPKRSGNEINVRLVKYDSNDAMVMILVNKPAPKLTKISSFPDLGGDRTSDC